MANNHEQFIAFNNTIKVTDTQKGTLQTNREAIREKVRKYYKDTIPMTYSQSLICKVHTPCILS